MKKIEDTIKKESRPVALMTTKANKLTLIKTDKDVTKATEFLIQVKTKIKSLEYERLEYTKPINETLKKLNARFKELSTPLKNAEKIVKNAILKYREKKEEQLLKIESEFKKKNKNQNIDITSTLPDIVESKSGETRISKKWTFEITDERNIPRDYVSADADKINDAINKGTRKIKGIRIFQKERVSVYGS